MVEGERIDRRRLEYMLMGKLERTWLEKVSSRVRLSRRCGGSIDGIAICWRFASKWSEHGLRRSSRLLDLRRVGRGLLLWPASCAHPAQKKKAQESNAENLERC